MKLDAFLLEYLQSDFKFGFELEAIGDHLGMYKKFIRKFWGPGGRFVYDSTISTIDVPPFMINGRWEPVVGFEYQSPVIPFNPANIKKLYEFLNSLKANNIVTNKSCGFHVHLSFPDISDRDAIWVTSHLSLDIDMRDKLLHLTPTIKFSSIDFASPRYLNIIEHMIRTGVYKNLSLYFSSEKYRSLRIHPQGTLEWRGPRNFLDAGSEVIKKFVLLLYEFTTWIRQTLDKDTILNMTKEEYLNLVGKKRTIFKKKRTLSKFSASQDKPLIGDIMKKFPWLGDRNVSMKLAEIKIDRRSNKLKWRRGTWENGVWQDGIWMNGLWKRGTWESGVWQAGRWLTGTWKSGIWKRGTWESGVWQDGTWKNGNWFGGVWEKGIWESGLWLRGSWKDGQWKAGRWRSGVWENGIWNHGEWKDGTWEKGVWQDGTWFDGYWHKGIWRGGTWERGKIYVPTSNKWVLSTGYSPDKLKDIKTESDLEALIRDSNGKIRYIISKDFKYDST